MHNNRFLHAIAVMVCGTVDLLSLIFRPRDRNSHTGSAHSSWFVANGTNTRRFVRDVHLLNLKFKNAI